ncbi:uncharacterized [Tachysurus ichikawai]
MLPSAAGPILGVEGLVSSMETSSVPNLHTVISQRSHQFDPVGPHCDSGVHAHGTLLKEFCLYKIRPRVPSGDISNYLKALGCLSAIYTVNGIGKEELEDEEAV